MLTEVTERKFFTQDEAERLERENTWLRLQLSFFENEQKQFASENALRTVQGELVHSVPPIPPPAIRNTVSSPSLAGYLLTADTYAITLAGLIPAHARVLDLGCGCGKHARSLLSHPQIQSYIGFDAYRPSIEWCIKHLVPASGGRFEFHFVDVITNAYNFQGSIRGTDVVFPAATGAIDFAFAASVFTHLLLDDAMHYLRETHRTMDPHGTFLATIIETEDGADYSGDEMTWKYRPVYFIDCAERAGFRLLRHLGKLFEQDAFLFTPA